MSQVEVILNVDLPLCIKQAINYVAEIFWTYHLIKIEHWNQFTSVIKVRYNPNETDWSKKHLKFNNFGKIDCQTRSFNSTDYTIKEVVELIKHSSCLSSQKQYLKGYLAAD